MQCLGKDCKFNPLDSAKLDPYFLFACFETKNESREVLRATDKRHICTRGMAESVVLLKEKRKS